MEKFKNYEDAFSFDCKSEHNAWIQWKGTDVCMDATCVSCGYSGHIDGMFAYIISCPKCGQKHYTSGYIKLIPIENDQGYSEIEME